MIAQAGWRVPEVLRSDALAGDDGALATRFESQRLHRLMRLWLDGRLSGPIDSDDVLQDANLEDRKRLVDLAGDPSAAVSPLAPARHRPSERRSR